MSDPAPIDNALYRSTDRYSLTDLNDVVARFAGNDELMAGIEAALRDYLDTAPFPPSSAILSPAQLKAAIETIYGNTSTGTRIYPVVPPEAPRELKEIIDTFGVEPFVSLIEGAELGPSQWLPVMRIFTLLKGMVYLVQDGPNYEADPVYAVDGSAFLTSIPEPGETGRVLLCSATGQPLHAGTGLAYHDRPAGLITLVEFLLRRSEVRKLRTLWRIGSFEIGVDAKYRSSMPHDLVDQAFLAGTSPEAVTKHFPCGFAHAGQLLFLKSHAGYYRGDNLAAFLPPSGSVEDRVVMDESMIVTPMGVMRVPRCLLSWGDRIIDADRQFDPSLGDGVVFVGLRLTASLVKRSPTYDRGAAVPASVAANGFNNGISLTAKAAAPAFENDPTPLSGTQAQHIAILGQPGHQQGNLIGFIQQDDVSSPVGAPFGQWMQVNVSLATVVVRGREILDQAFTYVGGPDEIGRINGTPPSIDVAPFRCFGTAPRRILPLVSPHFPGFGVDHDQGCLTSFIRNPGVDVVWEAILPVGLHLMRRREAFSLNSPNGCAARFADAWAIRKVLSVQADQGTFTVDNGLGQPESFPVNFVGSEATFTLEDGSQITSTVIERVGDQFMRLPLDVAAKIAAGDVVTFDRRVSAASMDGAYEREVALATFVDLRLLNRRLVDTTVTPSSAGLLSPSPSPAQPWTALTRTRTAELAADALGPHLFESWAIESKLRWDHEHKWLAKASERRDLVPLSSNTIQVLLDYLRNYDANQNRDWIPGESTIIHYPAKSPVTTLFLRGFGPPVIPGQGDTITVENVPEWGDVPVLTRSVRASDHYRYPLRFVAPLTFASEKSFQIPGHNKLAGTFSLIPLDTWILEKFVSFRLFRLRKASNGVVTRVFLGSFDLDHSRASIFANVTGVFRVDGDATFSPITGRVNINYNQTLDFTSEEPGELDVTFAYNDLSQVHPVFQIKFNDLEVLPSHLFTAQVLVLKDGKVQPSGTVLRLEGITISGGIAYLRFNRDDVFAAIAARGFIQTKWVLRNLPWITITGVQTDPLSGQPIAVSYDAQQVRFGATFSTQNIGENRSKQFYIPCNLKYGWTDPAQSNIHTEALPFSTSPRFGFYELDDIKLDDGTVPTAGAVLIRPVVDYRFLAPFSGSVSGLTEVRSCAIMRNLKTGELKTVVGVFRSSQPLGDGTTLSDELTLATVMDQPILFLSGEGLGVDWVPDFAGVLCMARDDVQAVSPSGDSKLTLVGYWYAGHEPKERGGMSIVLPGGNLQVDPGQLKINAAFWRIGDVAMSHGYRGNNLLWTDRRRPV